MQLQPFICLKTLVNGMDVFYVSFKLNWGKHLQVPEKGGLGNIKINISQLERINLRWIRYHVFMCQIDAYLGIFVPRD